MKVDGEELEIPEDEVLSGYSRTAKFTKLTMQLADQRKVFEAERQQAINRENQINEFFKDPKNIARYYEELTGTSLTPAQAKEIAANAPETIPGGDDFATVATVHQLAQREAAAQAKRVSREVQEQISRQLAETQRWTTEQIQGARAEAEQQRKAVEYHGELTSTLSSLLEKYPVLGAVDDIENVMCAEAQRMDPANIAEAKQCLQLVAKGRAEKLDAHFTSMQKKSAIAKAKLQHQGIEPPGGNGLATSPTSFKLGDKGLAAAAADWLDKNSKQK